MNPSERPSPPRSVPPPPPSNPPSVEILAEIGLFGGLSTEMLADFTQRLGVQQLEPGDVVFREGEQGRDLFVVLGGELEVLKGGRDGGRETRVAMLGPGDWFGEMSILDVMPRSATVRVVALTRLIRLSASDLDSLYRRDIKSYAIVVLNLAREMSRRLRVADGVLADVMSRLSGTYSRNR
jgi:CRP/FNR family cyclic AMP-dependent transcriptional regulator